MSEPEVPADLLGMLDAPAPTQTTINVYLAVLRARRTSIDKLLGTGFTEAELDASVDFLIGRGLLVRYDQNQIEAISPEIALPAIAAQMEARARTVRSSTGPLQRLFLGAGLSAQVPPEGMTPLATLDELAFATHQVVDAAREWVMVARLPSLLTDDQLLNPYAPEWSPSVTAGAGEVRMLVNYSTDLLRHPNMLALLSLRAEKGYEQRMTRGLPLSALLNEQGDAVMELTNPRGQTFGLLLSSESGSRSLQDVMRWAWQHGVPWTPRRAGVANSQGLDQRDQQILQLLAGGATDATIARQTGISQRTVERRIRVIMDRLGAATRFQAGLLAARDKLL
jgi:DNA-binding CsgD family transcriptional regulator